MEPITYPRDKMESLRLELQKKFEMKVDPVEPRQVVIDFSKPSEANKWRKEMCASAAEPRPAGIMGQIRYYKEGDTGPLPGTEDPPNTYRFLLSSLNNYAATTKLLNYECRVPRNAPGATKTLYENITYLDIVKVLREKPLEIPKFVTSALRLIKGTSFLKKEEGKAQKWLVGLPETIDCALDFVAILLTSECLRDSRCKYLVFSEFYKLKKGQIDVIDLFHPLFARYVPARVTESDFSKYYAKDWPLVPKKKSEIASRSSMGGAQQLRNLTDSQIFDCFLDKEMQYYYQREKRRKTKDEQKLIALMEEIEEQRKLDEAFIMDDIIKKSNEMPEAEIKKIRGQIPGGTKQNEEIEKKGAGSAKALGYLKALYRNNAGKREDEYRKAEEDLHKLVGNSFSGFFGWATKKPTKAHKYCGATGWGDYFIKISFYNIYT